MNDVRYLVCNHCGHPNPIETEFFLSCNSCGRRPENVFADWKRAHPDGTFETYRTQVGVAAMARYQREKSARRASARTRGLLWFGAVLVLFSGIIYGLSRSAEQLKPLLELVTGIVWQSFSEPEYGFEMELPFMMEAIPVADRTEWPEVLDDLRRYQKETSTGFVQLTFETYTEEAGALSAQASVQRLLDQFEAVDAFAGTSVSENEVEGLWDGVYEVRGTTVLNGHPRVIWVRSVVQGRKMVQLLALFPDSETARSQLDRSFGSVKMEK